MVKDKNTCYDGIVAITVTPKFYCNHSHRQLAYKHRLAQLSHPQKGHKKNGWEVL